MPIYWLKGCSLFDILRIFQLLLGILIGITVHECLHAWMAYKLGDPTPKFQGRVTLNPVAHLDPVGSIMMVITAVFGFGFGWGKPVVWNPYNIRVVSPKTALTLVAVAGPLSNLAVAALFSLPMRFGWVNYSENEGLFMLLFYIAFVNIILAIFNLLPVPPLDGFHVIQGILPRKYDATMAIIEQYGPLILLAVVFIGINLIGPAISTLARTILTIFSGLPFV